MVKKKSSSSHSRPTSLEKFLIQFMESSLDQSKENSNNNRNHIGSNDAMISLEENVHEIEVETINNSPLPSSTSSSRILTDQNIIASISVEKGTTRESRSKIKQYSATYQQSWEQKVETMYKTYEFDLFGAQKEKLICWLYSTDNKSMRCRLCEKCMKTKNSNGKLVKNTFLSLRINVIL